MGRLPRAGAGSFRVWIEHTLKLAAELAERVRRHPRMELLAEPTLSTVCFRHLPQRPVGAEPDLDRHNSLLAAAIQRDGRAFVTPTSWNGKGAIRAAFDNWATGPEDVAILWDAISDIGQKTRLEG